MIAPAPLVSLAAQPRLAKLTYRGETTFILVWSQPETVADALARISRAAMREVRS